MPSISMMPMHEACQSPVTMVTVRREINAEIELTWQGGTYIQEEKTDGLEDGGIEIRCEQCLGEITDQETRVWILERVNHRPTWMKEHNAKNNQTT